MYDLCEGHEDEPPDGGGEEVEEVLGHVDQYILRLEDTGIPEVRVYRDTDETSAIVFRGRSCSLYMHIITLFKALFMTFIRKKFKCSSFWHFNHIFVSRDFSPLIKND